MSKLSWLRLAAVLFALTIVGTRAYLINVDDMSSGRHFTHGDGESDRNTMSAVRYFHDFGLWESKLRPMHAYTGDKSTAHAYTHYPALPDVVAGVSSIVYDSTDERVMRVTSIVLSLGFLFMLWRFCLFAASGDEKTATISFVALVLSNYYIAWADNLHKHLFEELFKVAYLLLLISYYRSSGQRALKLLAAAVVAVLAANSSFEPITFLACATVGLSFVYHSKSGRGFWRTLLSLENVALGLAFIAGVALHMYLNRLYFGSWQATIADLTDAARSRAGMAEGATGTAHQALRAKDILKIPLTILARADRYFIVPGIAIVVAGVYAIRRWKTEDRERYGIALSLLVASVSWYFVMPQHAVIHHFVGKQTGLLVAMVLGPGAVLYLARLKNDFGRRARPLMALHALFLLFIIAMALTQTVLVIWWAQGLGRWF